MITIKEIAKDCNVSPSTVSNILNNKDNVSEQTRQRVLEYVQKSSYQPNYYARGMRQLSSRTISIITEDLLAVGTSAIVESSMAYCDDNNYRTMLMNLRLYDKWRDTWYDDREKLKASVTPVIKDALSIRVEGIIYVAGHCRMIDFLPTDLPIPLVIVFGISGCEPYPSVVIDDEQGGYDITTHLIEKGHTKIGVITGIPDNMHAKSRLLGYQRALFDNGILFDPSLVLNGNWRRYTGYREAQKFIGQNITAIFCMNDEMAAGAYDCFLDSDIAVGRDISIVGYDNNEISDYIRPSMTTNEIPFREVGMKSADIMLRMLNKQDYDMNVKIPCKVIERSSVASINE